MSLSVFLTFHSAAGDETPDFFEQTVGKQHLEQQTTQGGTRLPPGVVNNQENDNLVSQKELPFVRNKPPPTFHRSPLPSRSVSLNGIKFGNNLCLSATYLCVPALDEPCPIKTMLPWQHWSKVWQPCGCVLKLNQSQERLAELIGRLAG